VVLNDPNLEFLDQILSAHFDRLDPNALRVIPAVHDEMDAEHSVLQSVVERHGGAYVRCDPGTTGYRRAKGPMNDDLARYLESLCRGRGVDVEITEQGDDIHVDAPDGSEPTGSMQVFYSVLSALASSELDQDFALLTYSLDGFDRSRAALLWDATLAIATFPPPQLHTFIPIAGGTVDVDAHCGRIEGSVRLVVRNGSTTVRNGDDLLSSALNRILDRIDRPIVLFLGAGASASARIPQGNRYRDLALEQLVTGPDFEVGFREWLETNQRWLAGEREMPPNLFARGLTLERVLREEFHSLGGRGRSEAPTVARMTADCSDALQRLPEGRKALRELGTLLPHLIVATVNFDRLVEQDLGSPHEVLVDQADFARGPSVVGARLVNGISSPLPILKLHGSIERPETLIANIDDTTRGLSDEVTSTLDSIFESDRPLTWVWVGCSMRDIDVNMWSRRKDGASDMQEWWVDPIPPKTVAEYAVPRAREWATIDQELRSKQITETADRFLVALLARARELVP
jgi:hypothetical protein